MNIYCMVKYVKLKSCVRFVHSFNDAGLTFLITKFERRRQQKTLTISGAECI